MPHCLRASLRESFSPVVESLIWVGKFQCARRTRGHRSSGNTKDLSRSCRIPSTGRAWACTSSVRKRTDFRGRGCDGIGGDGRGPDVDNPRASDVSRSHAGCIQWCVRDAEQRLEQFVIGQFCNLVILDGVLRSDRAVRAKVFKLPDHPITKLKNDFCSPPRHD